MNVHIIFNQTSQIKIKNSKKNKKLFIRKTKHCFKTFISQAQNYNDSETEDAVYRL